jgi:hypothetical protein
VTRAKSKGIEKLLADLKRLADELRKGPEHMEEAAKHATIHHGITSDEQRLHFRIGGLEQRLRSAADGIDLKLRHIADELKLER